MAEVAPGPEENAGITCVRVVLTPVAGSDLVLGQMLLEDFFFEDQVQDSAVLLCTA
jgi:hypothetical protein